MEWQTFMQTWTPEKAWWWGVMLGDGCVYYAPKTGDYRVHLVGSESTVQRWLQLLHPTRQAQKLKRANAYQGYIGCKALVDWLCENGMRPRKTHDLQWPEGLPDELLPHFLRGLWDTDGSISVWDRAAAGHPGRLEFKARYASACEAFVVTLRDKLAAHMALPPRSITRNETSNGVWWDVKYSGSLAMVLVDLLYKDAPEHIRNEDRVATYRKMVAAYTQEQNLRCACGADISESKWCRTCRWDGRRKTGEGTACACGKKVLAKGLCAACYSRERRAEKAATT